MSSRKEHTQKLAEAQVYILITVDPDDEDFNVDIASNIDGEGMVEILGVISETLRDQG